MSTQHIAIACQGGGSHAAYAAGALPALLPQFANARIAQQPQAEIDKADLLQLAGISGTSGGAISALLAWYGFLLGGPDAARERLEAFWNANCAILPGERLLNDALQLSGAMSQVDLKLSPYLSPLRDIGAAATVTWPMLAALYPALGEWMRGSYFQLRESVAPHADFELIAALGDFCSIALQVKRWQSCALEARLGRPDAATVDRLHRRQQEIADGIRAALALAPWIVDWAERHRLPQDCLLRTVFEAWRAPEFKVEHEALSTLARQVRCATRTIPQLLIGAVDVDSGAFVAFSSERAACDTGITLDAVVASASLPWVFKAQIVEGVDAATHEKRRMACWDGLLSQNPPIRNFISTKAGHAPKPDGIWILQINQDRYEFEARVSAEGLWHRRDTLADNLSLNQEVAFIEAVNRRLDDPGQRTRTHDKPIEVVRIVMDGDAVGAAARRQLGQFSKFDRDAGLAQALLAHGREQATRYLALRQQCGLLWEALAQDVIASGAQPSARMEAARKWLHGAARLAGGLVAPDVITIDGARGANLRWHASEAELDGQTLRIRGSTQLELEQGIWQLADTHLLDVEQGGIGQEEASAPQAWPVARQKRDADDAGEILH